MRDAVTEEEDAHCDAEEEYETEEMRPYVPRLSVEREYRLCAANNGSHRRPVVGEEEFVVTEPRWEGLEGDHGSP